MRSWAGGVDGMLRIWLEAQKKPGGEPGYENVFRVA